MERIVQIVFNGKIIDSSERRRKKKNVVRDLVRHLFCYIFFMFPSESVLYYFRNIHDTTIIQHKQKSVTSFCNTKSVEKGNVRILGSPSI